MEKAAVAGRSGSGWKVARGPGVFAAAAVCMLCPAMGQERTEVASAEVLVAEARVEPPPLRMQVQTSALPRLDAQDAGFQAPRVDVSLMSPSAGGSALGPVLGVSGVGPSLQGQGLQARTGVDVGLRFTQRLQSQHQIDVTAWRRLNNPDDAYTLIQMRQPVYGARVELNLKPVRKSGLALDRGFVGFQMEGGGRITIKRKDGRPMVYYRTSF